MRTHFFQAPRFFFLRMVSFALLLFGCTGEPEFTGNSYHPPPPPTPPAACKSHADCPSGMCFPGFRVSPFPGGQPPYTCVAESLVKYVDHDGCNQGKSDSAHLGSRQDPFCQVSTAVSQGPFVLAKPTQSGYDAVLLPVKHAAVIVGGGRTSNTVVRGIRVQDAGSEAYLDGLSLATQTDLLSMPAGTGLVCNNQAVVTLVNSRVSSNTTGIEASACKHLQVEKSYIGNNGNVGISLLLDSGFQIVNSLIVQNGGVGINFGSANGGLAFSTVSQNGMDTRAGAQNGGAFLCSPSADPSGAHPISIQNSLLIGNQMNGVSPTPTQIQGSTCQLESVVVSPRDALPSIHPNSQGITKTEVAFSKQGTEWRIDLTSPSWDPSLVIDRGQVGMVDAAMQDYFGTPRPRAANLRKPAGTGYDIGHQQVTP